jgi:hypothetical protein
MHAIIRHIQRVVAEMKLRVTNGERCFTQRFTEMSDEMRLIASHW